MSKPTTDARGRRYSPAQRREVLDFITRVNREKGRGGQLAAYRKYGIAQLTLKLWMRQGPGFEDHPSASHDATEQTLLQLRSLATKIGKLEKHLIRMRHDYQRMKAKS